MKIYTGTGDRGKTSLFSGERITKADGRIDTYGDIDELNSILGALAASWPADSETSPALVFAIQSHLLHVGAWLATTSESPRAEALTPVDSTMWAYLEDTIDRMDADLPPLSGFILPGGHPSAAWAHVARTVCRRAERSVVRFAQSQPPSEMLTAIITYLNRLSDLLFVLARYLNHQTGQPDRRWNG
ncbi:MAG: cob(I)yrinic acid a,c-diamide adenosyltransferase [Desulfobacterales bacterium]